MHGRFFSLKYRINAGSEAYYGFISHGFRLQKKGGSNIMIAVASLIVLTRLSHSAQSQKKNAGVVGLVAAYIFSIVAAKCGTEINVSKVVTGNWRAYFYRSRHHIPLWYCFPRTSYVSQEENAKILDLLSSVRSRRTDRRSHHAVRRS